MSESLVVIRTFDDLPAADDAQVDLLSAGIYSLIFTDENVSLAPGHGIALAVHRRDANLAETVLDPSVDPAVHLGRQ